MKKNKKMVKIIKKVVSKGTKDYAVIKVKGKSILNDMKKRWDKSESKRKILEANVKKAVVKIEQKGKKIVGKSIQFKKDIVKGVKLGLKK